MLFEACSSACFCFICSCFCLRAFHRFKRCQDTAKQVAAPQLFRLLQELRLPLQPQGGEERGLVAFLRPGPFFGLCLASAPSLAAEACAAAVGPPSTSFVSASASAFGRRCEKAAAKSSAASSTKNFQFRWPLLSQDGGCLSSLSHPACQHFETEILNDHINSISLHSISQGIRNQDNVSTRPGAASQCARSGTPVGGWDNTSSTRRYGPYNSLRMPSETLVVWTSAFWLQGPELRLRHRACWQSDPGQPDPERRGRVFSGIQSRPEACLRNP